MLKFKGQRRSKRIHLLHLTQLVILETLALGHALLFITYKSRCLRMAKTLRTQLNLQRIS